MNIIERVRKSLNITSAAFDDELRDVVEAARRAAARLLHDHRRPDHGHPVHIRNPSRDGPRLCERSTALQQNRQQNQGLT